MDDDGRVTPRRATARRRGRRAGGRLLASILALLCLADAAQGRITIRRHSPYDKFFFHGNYSLDPFDPADAFTLQLWNCANGTMPAYVPDREPQITCDDGAGVIAGAVVYSVDIPAGACVDHGRSCYYRDTTVPTATPGVRFFKVRYARLGDGNKVWLRSYGDLSSADRANMLVLIEIDGLPTALQATTFTPLRSGGWFSP